MSRQHNGLRVARGAVSELMRRDRIACTAKHYLVWTKPLARRTLRVEYTPGIVQCISRLDATPASVFVLPTSVKRQCRTVKVLSPLLPQAEAISTVLGEGGFLKLHR